VPNRVKPGICNFGHPGTLTLGAQLTDETDAKKILTASPWRTGGDHWDALVPHG